MCFQYTVHFSDQNKCQNVYCHSNRYKKSYMRGRVNMRLDSRQHPRLQNVKWRIKLNKTTNGFFDA